jgi:hypothetical protein
MQEAGGEVRLREYPDLGHVRILGALRYETLAPTRADLLEFVHARR